MKSSKLFIKYLQQIKFLPSFFKSQLLIRKTLNVQGKVSFLFFSGKFDFLFFKRSRILENRKIEICANDKDVNLSILIHIDPSIIRHLYNTLKYLMIPLRRRNE